MKNKYHMENNPLGMKKICSSLFGYFMAFVFVACAANPMLNAQDAEEEDMLNLLFKSNEYALMSPSERASLLLLDNEHRAEYVLDNVLFLKDISSIYNITFDSAHYSIDSIELFTSPSIAQYYYNLAMSSNRDFSAVFDTVALPEDVEVDVLLSIHDSSKCVIDEANTVQCPLTKGILLNILNAYYSCNPAQRAIFYDTFCNPNNNSEVARLFGSRLRVLLTQEQQLSFVNMVARVDLESVDDGNGNIDAFLYGGLPGVFTVDINGSKVHFSKGNIQYRASTNEWRFAENQYDFCGSSNANISSTNSDWIDLFGWGSGDLSITPPYTYAQTASYGPSDERDIVGSTSDWGSNPIINGGNEPNIWRTLTKEEWNYLLSSRDGMRFVKAVVNSIDGIILFPDGYVSDSSIFSFSFVNQGNSNAQYASNVVNAAKWVKLDSVGCVFLPSAGFRSANTYSRSYGTVSSNCGLYWSSTSNDEKAYDVWFNDSVLRYGDSESLERYLGMSVRVVRDVPIHETDNENMQPADGTTTYPSSNGINTGQ